MQAIVVAAAKRVAQPGIRITNVSHGAEKQRVSLSAEEAHAFYVEKHGMDNEEFQEKLASGSIEILADSLREVATHAARVFGPGSLGVDAIVDQETGQAKILEVNPFAGGSKNFEKVHGFDIYGPWAESFADFVVLANRQRRDAGSGKWSSKINAAQDAALVAPPKSR